MAEWFRISGDRITINIKAVPGASKTAFAGVKDGRLRVRIAAAPEGGKANGELAAFLAKSLGCARKEIVLQSGERSRLKTLVVPLSARQKLELLGENDT